MIGSVDMGIIITIFNMFQKLEEIFNILEMGKTSFNSQIKLQEMITTISEIENTIGRINILLDIVKENVSEFEDIATETTNTKHEKGKHEKKSRVSQ